MQCETAGPAFLRGLVRETHHLPSRKATLSAIDDSCGRERRRVGRDSAVRSHLDRTGREIAGNLYISEKTASVHVSNIMAKLEAANRTEAGAKARALGLDRL